MVKMQHIVSTFQELFRGNIPVPLFNAVAIDCWAHIQKFVVGS